jgi:hypothetical protein
MKFLYNLLFGRGEQPAVKLHKRNLLTTFAEVDANRHPILPDSERYEIVRYIREVNIESGMNTITLTLIHRQTGERKCLRFDGVSHSHPLMGCTGLYIVDTSYRQWEQRVRIEVGEYFEDGGVYFQAESVEEIPEAPTHSATDDGS